MFDLVHSHIDLAETISAIILGSVLINEVAGPLLTKLALARAGRLRRSGGEADLANPGAFGKTAHSARHIGGRGRLVQQRAQFVIVQLDEGGLPEQLPDAFRGIVRREQIDIENFERRRETGRAGVNPTAPRQSG